MFRRHFGCCCGLERADRLNVDHLGRGASVQRNDDVTIARSNAASTIFGRLGVSIILSGAAVM
jgi:hypothetical protein